MTHARPLGTGRIGRRTLLLAVAAALLASGAAQAQAAWPTKPVTIVVPIPAGGGTDAFVSSEIKRWAEVVKTSGAKLD